MRPLARLFVLLLAGLCPALASAQALPPDTLRALAGRMHAEGLLTDSLLADARARIDAGRLTLRSSLLASAEASAFLKLGLPAERGGLFGGMYAFGPEQLVPLGAQRAAYRRSGALTPPEDRALMDLFAARFPDSLRARSEAVLDTLRAPPVTFPELAAGFVAAAEPFHPDALAPFADTLVHAGVMTSEARTRFVADAAASFADLLEGHLTGYLNTAFLVDTRGEKPVSEADLAAAYERVAAWLRAAGIADVQLVRPRVDSASYSSAMFEAVVDGRTYRHMAAYNRAKAGEPADFAPNDRAFDFFNRVLRDRRSPHRLYVIGKARYEGDVPLVALTAAQANAINAYRTPRRRVLDAWVTAQEARGLPKVDSPEAERLGAEATAMIENERLLEPPFTVAGSADTLYTSAYLDTFWDRLGAAGTFDGWTHARRDSARRHLHDLYVTQPWDLVEALGPLAVRFGEMSTAERPYAALLREVAEATRGAFRPEDVEDTYGASDSVRVAFRAGGRRFEARFRQDGDWYTTDGIRLILDAARQAVPSADFYTLLGSDEAYAFLTPAQHAVFEAYGLVRPGPKPWFDGD